MSTPDCTASSTLTIRIGFDPGSIAGDVMPPIHVASTFVQDRPDKLREGYEHERCGSLTTNTFAGVLVALEVTTHGLAFSSGVSVEDIAIRLLARPGDHIMHPTNVYGDIHESLGITRPAEGITSETVDPTDLVGTERVIREPRPQIVWVETPSSPSPLATDIATTAASMHEVGSLLIVDNTFTVSVLQHPLKLGADVAVHLTTKYVDGHSDVAGDVFILHDGLGLPAHVNSLFGERDAAAEAIELQMVPGHVPSPHDVCLAHCDSETLAPHVKRHCENAQKIVKLLAIHPRVTIVHYPGPASDPGRKLTQRQSPADAEGVFSFRVATEEFVIKLMARTHVFAPVTSLGVPESLIEHLTIMTCSTRMEDVGGVPSTSLCLAVGLEDMNDLIMDLDQTLAQTRGSSPRERNRGSPGGDAR